MSDLIDRQKAIEALQKEIDKGKPPFNDTIGAVRCGVRLARNIIEDLPSAQPEQRCLNCGRTANNGGWYEDGGTRCPIEEHYALPKDGYCHLWEKRKVWEDDYVKRSEDNAIKCLECSECGDYPLKNEYGHEKLSAFCPNCGAAMKMEGGEE